MTKSTRKTKNRILAIPAAPAAMPPKPKSAATKAMTRKQRAAQTFVSSPPGRRGGAVSVTAVAERRYTSKNQACVAGSEAGRRRPDEEQGARQVRGALDSNAVPRAAALRPAGHRRRQLDALVAFGHREGRGGHLLLPDRRHFHRRGARCLAAALVLHLARRHHLERHARDALLHFVADHLVEVADAGLGRLAAQPGGEAGVLELARRPGVGRGVVVARLPHPHHLDLTVVDGAEAVVRGGVAEDRRPRLLGERLYPPGGGGDLLHQSDALYSSGGAGHDVGEVERRVGL